MASQRIRHDGRGFFLDRLLARCSFQSVAVATGATATDFSGGMVRDNQPVNV